MGRFLTPGHTYVDGSTVTGPNLTEHVAEASFNTTAFTEQTLRTPAAALTDQLLVVAGGLFFQETLQQIHDLILYPGSVVQTKYGEYTANTNLTTVIPNDDTVPQNTEGTEIINVSITPRFLTSTILAEFHGQFSTTTVADGVSALFRDSVVNALAAQVRTGPVADQRHTWGFSYMDSPATISAINYKIRVGPSGGTMRLNGSTATRQLGGASRATLTLQEIKV